MREGELGAEDEGEKRERESERKKLKKLRRGGREGGGIH
jgi:hypothetical protein